MNYIQQGSNTIAIGLVAANANQKEAIFDGALRLMGEETASRVFDYTVSYSGISGSPSSMLNQYYSYTVYYSSCSNNYYNIAFNNDRHEWINSITIKLYYSQNTQLVRQFVLKGRNGSDDWTTIATVTDLTWSQAGQAQTIYFQNNKAYHEYRFENFATGDTSECYWKFNTLDLVSVYTTMTIPELSYESTTIFKDVEMGEMYPNSEYYFNFQISPALPNGISLDVNSGMISGTAKSEMAATSYSITATKLTGGTSTASFSLTVSICTRGRSLVTLVARTDSYPEQSSYKLYQGIGTSGTVVRSIDRFATSTSLNYGDFCLNDGIYTLELLDSSSNGWTNPAGYYLTVDIGEMIFEMGQVPSGVASVSTMFSSYFPFQIEYTTDWKINYNYVEDWNTLEFDDSGWTSKKASEIGTNMGITTYIRKEVNIPDINNYHVLNVRVKYAGGVAAYFNGRLVARFNLEENFDSASKSITIHNQDTFSKFHVILPTVGGVTGKNIMAFEIHLPLGQSSSSPVIFDATGVFGVNDCSIVVDTIVSVDGSTVYLVDLEELFDLSPVTYGYQSNSENTYLSWEVENLEGSKFNSFGMQTVYARSSYGFSLYARRESTDDETSALSVLDQSTKALDRCTWSVPVGIAGFRYFRFKVDDTASSIVYVSSYMFLYCKPSGTGLCSAVGDYPSVGEGEISPGPCEEGYRGYSYRTCLGGVLGEINNQYCTQKEPAKLTYSSSVYHLIYGTNIHIDAPEYLNIITEFSLADNTFLPAGLMLNSHTGEITGMPTEEYELRTYTIYGKNDVGTTYTTINISVKRGTCRGEGNFPDTSVGETYIYDCASGGSYVGIVKRTCILGEKDGEWQNPIGSCISVLVIIIIVVVAIIVVFVIIFILVRVTRRTKAVGGVKGRSAKSSGSQRTLSKKNSAKAVKV